MDITVQTVLTAIDTINKRKIASPGYIPSSGRILNVPIGIDSLAFELKVKAENVSLVIDEMIAFGVLEIVQQKTRRGGSMGIKMVRLKE